MISIGLVSGFKTTHGSLLVDYQTNMKLIQAMMVLYLVSFIFIWVPFMDDDTFSGSGGAIACAILWFGYVIVFSVAILIIVLKKSETAAMMGWLIVCVTLYGLWSSDSNLIFKLAYSILPIVLTVLIIRMLWYIYMLAKTPPPRSPVDYPVTPPPEGYP